MTAGFRRPGLFSLGHHLGHLPDLLQALPPILLLGLLLTLAACGKEEAQPLYETVAVERRDIVLSATASGTIEPVRTVEVKSKASGEIMEMHVETGDDVKARQLLARIDPRTPRNALSQAEANLAVARAQLANSKSEMARADTLFKRQVITQVEYENARLAFATANASVVRAETELESAQDQMDDTEIRAPASGTIMSKNVELGTVISSPTRDVGGGTVLLTMADLDTVQIRALVDETDIGKLQAGMAATLSVDAYPDRRFEGSVLKIEPLATVQQNVTMFPVLVRLANPGHLLKPGMTAEVEIHVGRRDQVLAIPYAALRTSRDVGSAASVLGIDPQEIESRLAAARDSVAATPARDSVASPPGRDPVTATPGDSSARGGATLSLPGGQTVTLPPGVSEAAVRAAMTKRMSGSELSDEERALLRKVFPRGTGRRSGDPENSASRYIVFELRDGKPVPLEIRTGLTDLDYVEVLEGLTEGDQVLVLPSASLVNAQRQFQERIQRMTGSGLPGVQQQTRGSQGSGQSR